MPYKDKEKALASGRKSYNKQMLDPEKKAARAAKMAAYMRNWNAKNKERLYADPVWVEKRRASKRRWAASHPESGRAWKLKKQYGLSYEVFQEKLLAQAGNCKICGDLMTSPNVDHDHSTGVVRDLLCGSCNKGLAMFREDSQRLSAAITYLSRWT